MNKKELTKVASYLAMSDGCIYLAKDAKNAQFVLSMIEDNEDFIDKYKAVLEHITTINKRKRKESKGKDMFEIKSRRHPFFTKLRKRIYFGSYKGIDPHALTLLDAEALSILYMCDGCLYMCRGTSPSVTLNLKRLSYGDQFILKKALKEKLDLEWNINKHGKYYCLRLRNKDVGKFMEMVSPYMCESFSYKLIPTNSPS